MNYPDFTVSSSRVLNLSPYSMELSQLFQFSVTVVFPFAVCNINSTPTYIALPIQLIPFLYA